MTRHPSRTQAGVMLLEALLGLLIFSIGILAMIAMQAMAMRTTVDSKYRSEAGFLGNEIVGLIWSDPANLANYDTTTNSCTGTATCNTWLTKVQATLPNATDANAPVIAVAGRQVTITIFWQPPGTTTPSNHQVVAQVYRATD